jgi:hypothetical protein
MEYLIAKMIEFMQQVDKQQMKPEVFMKKQNIRVKSWYGLLLVLKTLRNLSFSNLIKHSNKKNYVEDVLPVVMSEGKRLLGDSFIFQQDNATPHKSNLCQTWCREHLPDFIDSNRWPANSPT